MALQKSKTSKGITASYLQIYKQSYDKNSNKTLSRMRTYVDKSARDAGINNFIDIPEFKYVREFDGELTIAQAYEAWKKPIMQDVLDEDGKSTFEEDGVTKIQEDTNWFSDSTDVFEEEQKE
jgi:hypothetical protein